MNHATGRSSQEDGFDYIVVGSGAGGGPLAANLAEAGMRVLLLEAGSAIENDSYRVPAFFSAITEDPDFRWDMFVQHYTNVSQQERDTKYVQGKGILYPRGSMVGGSFGHSALITLYPHNDDWDGIAEATGDRSWRSRPMRRYFERLERCTYRPRPRLLPRNPLLAALLASLPLVSDKYVNRGRHGFDGWLETSLADPNLVTRDPQLLQVVITAAADSLRDFLGRPLTLFEGLNTFLDPNDWRAVQSGKQQGLWLLPMCTTTGGLRNSTRERIQAVQQRMPEKLVVRTNTLATRVLFDATNTAIGIEYLDGAHLYRADPAAAGDQPMPSPRSAVASREIILCAGAFNTPQLLKLSGIGPREELERHGIQTRVHRPGVGENLQDRYEVGVVSEMRSEFALFADCTFQTPGPSGSHDPCYADWQRGRGAYTTNGVIFGTIRKSQATLKRPDLIIFGTPFDFRGYYPGYSTKLAQNRTRFTWAILKAHTRNTAGRVQLRSADPRDTPDIKFHYFEEGNDEGAKDLNAVVTGIEFARDINRQAGDIVVEELVPGNAVRTRDQLRDFVRDEAWGHHASCTCKMGPREDEMAVVDSRFRVYGVRNLRVVDASVFPRIPGLFVALPVLMISEKASDVILSDVGSGPSNASVTTIGKGR